MRQGTRDQATVVGFAQTSKLAGEEVRCLIVGLLSTSGLNAGKVYYLSTNPGDITETPPSGSGEYVTRIGEASTTSNLIIQLEVPILLRSRRCGWSDCFCNTRYLQLDSPYGCYKCLCSRSWWRRRRR